VACIQNNAETWSRTRCSLANLIDCENHSRFGFVHLTLQRAEFIVFSHPDWPGRTGARAQRAGIAPPHAEGDWSSGVSSDGETFVFISVPAGVVGGVPLTRARNPWAMPEAST